MVPGPSSGAGAYGWPVARLGADVDQLDQLGVFLDRQATRIAHVQRSLRSSVQAVTWMGPDAQAFRGRWASTMDPQVSSAVAALIEQATLVRQQAEQQRLASAEASTGGWSAPQQAPTPPVGPPVPRDRNGLTTGQIRDRYNVPDDPHGLTKYPPFVGPTVTETEKELLEGLGVGLFEFKDIADSAFAAADERFPSADKNDDHNDAFRHAYWNALMTSRYGVDWAEQYGTAHEAIPGNPGDREAMDLYNNEVGRRIATEHPDASPEELADLVEQAVRDGEMVVIDKNGDLRFTDQITPGETGEPNETPEDPGSDDSGPDSGSGPGPSDGSDDDDTGESDESGS